MPNLIKDYSLGKRLKELRESQGIMQREVGAVIGVDGAFISKIESSEKRISRDHLKKLSLFFQIDEKELQILWLADKVINVLKDEPYKEQVIRLINNIN
ncbi:helix-turn-helix domain-containing protein [Zhouia spongiae]|uniref:Helix-turn-helix domain-containing protein n=1 Tax=Zhouia spongiae TaxID=2202721 RepID=A0ABY3YPU1_9FLAO|nr:helix-turn-helix transcriptional regulator [Zhouia spongiae]UNY99860.1 helix-turn-helix domain-containing protein [Zhouia spongiae]